MTPAGQQKLRQQVPDIANMNAAQLQQALDQKQMQISGAATRASRRRPNFGPSRTSRLCR